jgi:hypothetical protein
MVVVVVMVDKQAPSQSDHDIHHLHLSRVESGSELILKVMMQSQRIACEQRPQIVEQVGTPALDDYYIVVVAAAAVAVAVAGVSSNYTLEAVTIRRSVVGHLGNSHMLD